MHNKKIVLITTDNHTLGIQTLANIIYKNIKILPKMFYLHSNLPSYLPSIEAKIIPHIIREIDSADGKVLIGFHLKEMSLEKSIQLANSIKQYRRNKVILIAGGTYAMAEPLNLLSIFDYVVVGSGEGFLTIFNSVFKGKEINRIVISPPESFEYPLFTDCWIMDENGEMKQRRSRPLFHPQYKIVKALEIMLGVGCSFSCSYCEVASLRKIFGNNYKIRFAEPEKAIALIEKEIYLDSSIRYIYFFDEDFLLKPNDWIERFATLYWENIRLPFFIFTTTSSIRSSHKICTLSHVGLDTVNIGIQTGSEAIAKNIFGRKEDKSEIKTCVKSLVNLYMERKITSPPMLDFIILNPYEKIDDLLETVQLIIELSTPFNAIMHSMSFFRGTPLHKKAVDEGIIPKEYRFKYDLHDFISRVNENEFKFDYSQKESLLWLFLNVLLYGMRGIHKVNQGTRYLGSLTEKKLKLHLSSKNRVTYEDIISLAYSFLDPMDEIDICHKPSYEK